MLDINDVDFVFCQKIIKKLSRIWVCKLPEHTMYELDDLVSEGLEVFVKCCSDFDGKSKFTTYLCLMVRQRFMRIVRDERRRKRTYIKIELPEDLDNVNDLSHHNSDKAYCSLRNKLVYDYDSLSPEKLVMVHDAIIAISEVSVDFADMIKNGVPKKLFSLAIRHMRAKKIKNKPESPCDNIIFTKTMIKDFFGVDLKVLKELVYNII